MTETQIIPREPDTDPGLMTVAQTALSMPVQQMQGVLAEYIDRRAAFRKWLLSQLEEGVHYGVVPGTEAKRNQRGDALDYKGNIINPKQWRAGKPSLYKAGADFLTDLVMLDAKFQPDLDTWKMLGSREGNVVMKCSLHCRNESPFFPGKRTGDLVGEGHGSGTAGEKKRDANAAVKIAEKSAKVGAVIHALGLSDLFTQDTPEPAPLPQPDSDPDAPKAGTRDERKTEDAREPRVTGAQVIAVRDAWVKHSNIVIPTSAEEKAELIEAFKYFVDVSLGYTQPSDRNWLNASAWERQEWVAKCLSKCGGAEWVTYSASRPANS